MNTEDNLRLRSRSRGQAHNTARDKLVTLRTRSQKRIRSRDRSRDRSRRSKSRRRDRDRSREHSRRSRSFGDGGRHRRRRSRSRHVERGRSDPYLSSVPPQIDHNIHSSHRSESAWSNDRHAHGNHNSDGRSAGLRPSWSEAVPKSKSAPSYTAPSKSISQKPKPSSVLGPTVSPHVEGYVASTVKPKPSSAKPSSAPPPTRSADELPTVPRVPSWSTPVDISLPPKPPISKARGPSASVAPKMVPKASIAPLTSGLLPPRFVGKVHPSVAKGKPSQALEPSVRGSVGISLGRGAEVAKAKSPSSAFTPSMFRKQEQADKLMDKDQGLPPNTAPNPEVELFLRHNPVEPHCAQRLRDLPVDLQEKVMHSFNVFGVRNPTAVLLTRIREATADTNQGRDGPQELSWMASSGATQSTFSGNSTAGFVGGFGISQPPVSASMPTRKSAPLLQEKHMSIKEEEAAKENDETLETKNLAKPETDTYEVGDVWKLLL